MIFGTRRYSGTLASRMLRRACALALLMPLASLAAPAAQPAGPDLLFVSNADGDLEIYVVSGRDGSVSQLTDNAHDDVEAVWSPDGTRIAFTSMRDGQGEIYVMNADGSQQRRITDHPGLDSAPSWSPDGEQLVFTSDRSRYVNVYVVAVAGGEPVNLTRSQHSASAPQFSPDGEHIAWLETVGRGGKLALMRADGSGKRMLTAGEKGSDITFQWSPDGTRIAIGANRDGSVDVYVVDVASGEQVRLTDSPWIDTDPRWSPDGQRLLVLSARDDGERRQLYVMNADGSEQRRLTHDGLEVMNPAWSPAGDAAAFVRFENRRFVTVMLPVDGAKDIRRMSALVSGTELQPVYRPAAP